MHNEGQILTQKPSSQASKFKLRWIIALSSLPLFGMVAAFGIAPQTLTSNITVQTVVENLDLPKAAVDNEQTAIFWREDEIQRGDTIGALLSRLNVNDRQAINFLRSSKETQSLYRLRPGKTVRVKTTDDGELLSLNYVNSNGNLLQVSKDNGQFRVTESGTPIESHVLMKSGEIKSSLFAATDSANLPEPVAVQMAEIFSSDIDFHHDLRKGDKFTVVYEMMFHNGEMIKSGRVLAAEFINNGKSYRAVYFQDAEGKGGYYTPEGKNLRKAFLRSPLAFSRISSGFTEARFHPVLQRWRAHKGTDFAAPAGTPIKSTGDGTIAFIGTESGYGNMVLIQHQGAYSTAYGHLSRFAPGLHRGSKISQGDVIGYVGMTGLATGPHLHYEFRVAGIQKDPMGIALPVSYPVEAKYKSAFDNLSHSMSTRLNLLRTTNLAKLD